LATCKLQDDKGVYYVTTPGPSVHRAYGDMNVKCEKPGFDAGMATVKSSTKVMMGEQQTIQTPVPQTPAQSQPQVAVGGTQ
jgi:hypothetical protein